jgi:hypothetical protein
MQRTGYLESHDDNERNCVKSGRCAGNTHGENLSDEPGGTWIVEFRVTRFHVTTDSFRPDSLQPSADEGAPTPSGLDRKNRSGRVSPNMKNPHQSKMPGSGCQTLVTALRGILVGFVIRWLRSVCSVNRTGFTGYSGYNYQAVLVG